MFEAKNHLERIMVIDRLVRSGVYPSKKKLTDLFEISSKSIERDFSYMRDRLNAPLEYDSEKRGYYYSDESFFLPGNMMTEGEVFALLMSKEIIDNIGESPVKNQLRESCRKLEKYLPVKIKTDLGSQLSKFTFISSASVKVDYQAWNVILNALRENKKISYQYKTPNSDYYVKRELFPYNVISFRGSWYLLGLNPYRNRIENYSINRMKKLKITSDDFTYPISFKVDNFIDPEFGVYISDKEYSVSIKFHSWCAPYITERKWHENQKIEHLDDGGILLKFTTNQIEPVKQWVLTWGNGAIVLEPEELVTAMRDLVNKMAKSYNNTEK